MKTTKGILKQNTYTLGMVCVYLDGENLKTNEPIRIKKLHPNATHVVCCSRKIKHSFYFNLK